MYKFNKTTGSIVKIYFTAHHAKDNLERCQKLITLYGQADIQNCDIVVAIGGDGFMLETIHKVLPFKKPSKRQDCRFFISLK